MTTESRLAAPAIPGLELRPNDRGTAAGAEFAAIANACNAAEGVDEFVAAEDLVNWLTHTTAGFDPVRDVVRAEIEGRLVGYAWVDWVDTSDGKREFRLGGYVHPDHRRRGIGRRLVAWQESHAAGLPAAAPATTPLVYGTFAPEQRQTKIDLFARAGYETERWFFEMLRPNLDDVVLPPMPDGLEVRALGADRASLRKLWDADVDAFRGDHWGGFDASDGAFERSLADPDQDPSLYVVAWDGDQIAGGVTNTIYRAENEAFSRKRGWLETVFVRRPWRRRGLASALVARALVVLREAGMQEGMLGVDSDNPSGALGLYRRAGFDVHSRSVALRRPFTVDR